MITNLEKKEFQPINQLDLWAAILGFRIVAANFNVYVYWSLGPELVIANVSALLLGQASCFSASNLHPGRPAVGRK